MSKIVSWLRAFNGSRTERVMRWSRWVFNIAGVWGLLVTVPMFFQEEALGRDDPPPITHPEYFYGFAGLCLAWQLMFLVIASDPVRFRPAMMPAIVEKASFALAIPILFALERVSLLMFVASNIDALLGVLFIVAYLRTPRR